MNQFLALIIPCQIPSTIRFPISTILPGIDSTVSIMDFTNCLAESTPAFHKSTPQALTLETVFTNHSQIRPGNFEK